MNIDTTNSHIWKKVSTKSTAYDFLRMFCVKRSFLRHNRKNSAYRLLRYQISHLVRIGRKYKPGWKEKYKDVINYILLIKLLCRKYSLAIISLLSKKVVEYQLQQWKNFMEFWPVTTFLLSKILLCLASLCVCRLYEFLTCLRPSQSGFSGEVFPSDWPSATAPSTWRLDYER